MPPENGADQGADNMNAAISGDVSLHGANKDQIEALGGEFDDDLDSFDASKADRGDSLEPAKEPAKEPDESDDEDEESEAGDEVAEGDEDANKGAKDEDDDDSESDADADEDTDEDEDADDGDKEASGKKKSDEQRIPKSRFDEVNARRKAAEDELKALKAQQKAGDEGKKQTFDFDKAEEEYTELVLEGNTKEAIAKRKEIRAAERAEWEADSVKNTDATVEAKAVQRDLDEIVETYESQYAEFNPESETFSEDLVDEVQAFFTGYLTKRQDLTPQQAFHLAVNNAVKIYGLQKIGEGDATEGDKPAERKTVVKKGVKKDTKKKIALAKEAPKDTSKAGDAGDSAGDQSFDINSMTDAELDALPESTLRRLRGDTI